MTRRPQYSDVTNFMLVMLMVRQQPKNSLEDIKFLVLTYADGVPDKFYHAFMIAWCLNDLHPTQHSYCAEPLSPEFQYRVDALRDFVERIPNVYIAGPGDGVCWQDPSFDQQASVIVTRLSSHNIPFYNPKMMWRVMEHKKKKE